MLSLDDIREIAVEDNNLQYLILKSCLQTALQRIEDATEWVELVEAGYSATQAARMLGHDKKWLEQVRSVCLTVL